MKIDKYEEDRIKRQAESLAKAMVREKEQE